MTDILVGGDGVPIGLPGFWGGVTSSVDWCEMNYVWTVYVAELWNSISSLAMVLFGVVGFLLHRKVLEFRFLLAFVLVSVIGVGSTLFHASLKHYTQMADELPMLYLVFAVVFIIIENETAPKYGNMFPSFLLAWSVCTTLLVSMSEGNIQFFLFHCSFGSAEIYSLYSTYKIYKAHKARQTGGEVKTLFHAGMASYALGLIVWQFDLQKCHFMAVTWPAMTGLPNPQLHAWWHLLVATGFYFLIVMCAYDRLERLTQGKVMAGQPRVRYALGIVPYATLSLHDA